MMATYIERGDSLFIPFRNGQSISDSQCKPRIYKSLQNFEKSFPKHNLGNKNIEVVEYAEVKHGEWVIDTSVVERTFYEVNYKVLITCNICGNRHFLGVQPYPNFNHEDLKGDAYRKYRYCGECGAKMDGGKAE